MKKWKSRFLLPWLVVAGLFSFNGCKDPEDCTDGIDNDKNELTDCDDPVCANVTNCIPVEICDDGIDNDGDLIFDCQDLDDCQGNLACQEICSGGDDEDFDNATDCEDPDCAADPLCQEVCSGGDDEDLDGFIDCEDGDCTGDPACIEVCSGGVDEDIDGLTDCADLVDCANDPACFEAACGDNTDNDNDGNADCLDSDCFDISPDCVEQNCADGLDDDLDGNFDCADQEDCSAFAGCIEAGNCQDTVDNDLDGSVDCADADCNTDPNCTVVANGEACLGDGNCQSFAVIDPTLGISACLTESAAGFPSGTCTEDCTIGDDTTCTAGGTCVDLFGQGVGGIGLCLTPCDPAFACRVGYSCAPLGIVAENCTNVDANNAAVDDDGDGLANCADVADCNGDPGCVTDPALEICGNGIDDNNDGAIDCADADCATAGFCEGVCFPDCQNDGECAETGICDEIVADANNPGTTDGTGFCNREGICDNGEDDDNDGLFDCADPDCAGTDECPAQPDGSPCLVDAGCAGTGAGDGFCITEPDGGFPGGFCVTLCDPTAPVCPGDGFCIDQTQPGGQPTGICFDGCLTSNDCRAGYRCSETGDPSGADVCSPDCEADAQCTLTGQCNEFSGLCEPPKGLAVDGAPCLIDDDCESGICIDEVGGFPGGMCISLCDPTAIFCPGDGTCLDNGGAGEQPFGLCIDGCNITANCRTGYGCFDLFADAPLCFPDCDSNAECAQVGECNEFSGFCEVPGVGGIDGDPCVDGTDCLSGQCFSEDPASGQFPNGYCFSLCTLSANNCPADPADNVTATCSNLFQSTADLGICLDGCNNNNQCRVAEGYACQNVAPGGTNECF